MVNILVMNACYYIMANGKDNYNKNTYMAFGLYKSVERNHLELENESVDIEFDAFKNHSKQMFDK